MRPFFSKSSNTHHQGLILPVIWASSSLHRDQICIYWLIFVRQECIEDLHENQKNFYPEL